MPSENRLRRRQDFATAVRRGRRAGRPLLVVHLKHKGPSLPPTVAEGGTTDPHTAGGSPPPARAGFVVSKAVGGAVQRNLVKRRLRHLVRDRLPDLPPGSLVVVRALPGAAAADQETLARDLDAALRRLLGGGVAR
nr:ribonuclease P protein component [Streptomyces sp. SID5468]